MSNSDQYMRSGDHEDFTLDALRWLARQRDGLTAEETSQFAAWLGADAVNQEIYEDLERAWNLSGEATDDPAIMAMRKRATTAISQNYGDRRYGFGIKYAVAAMLVILGGPLFYYNNILNHGYGANKNTDTYQVVNTDIGQRLRLVLKDGSVVTMNTDSELRLRFTQTTRAITLQRGQALFEVANDRARPFVVAVGNRQVIAVGTEFDVRLLNKGVQVSLVEGVVKVKPRSGSPADGADGANKRVETLTAGQQLFVPQSGPTLVKALDVDSLLAWRNGRVRFDNTPLVDAVEEMNRYAKNPIVIADDSVKQIRISGAFRTEDSVAFAESLSKIFPVRVSTINGAVALSHMK